MAEFAQTRVRWNSSTSPDVASYRLYWAVGGGVGYNSDFAEIHDRTEVILPDQVPSFPNVADEIELGITAIDREGNESDIAKITVHFDSVVPDTPILIRPGSEGWDPPVHASVLIDDLNCWIVQDLPLPGPDKFHHTRCYDFDSHHIGENRATPSALSHKRIQSRGSFDEFPESGI